MLVVVSNERENTLHTALVEAGSKERLPQQRRMGFPLVLRAVENGDAANDEFENVGGEGGA